ncbi:hypothetical protein MDA_GLEAN10013413 [Myotis davidii]|uniref:Uncharacterized protein n=1 Tax=Myotis davidii TaxID=225400 RepID=L5LXW1_MYODS|nr:hypothetical protein MDA_GLEAN10013413 [Myotis davidii]
MASKGARKIERKENCDKSVEKTASFYKGKKGGVHDCSQACGIESPGLQRQGSDEVQRKREVQDSVKVDISREGNKISVEVSRRRTLREETTCSKGPKAGAS